MNQKKHLKKNVIHAGKRKLHIAFLHPELGIGGAERLVVDAALELQHRGHAVTVFTARHNKDYCFEETRSGYVDIRVRGSFIPSQIANHLRAPCSVVRMAYAALAMAISKCNYDIVFCDLVPHIIPLIRLASSSRIIYYCHYPDMLLAPVRKGIYSLYRYPVDRMEELGLGMADCILVNSEFTAGVLRKAFPMLDTKRVDILYPGVDLSRYSGDMTKPASLPEATDADSKIILSLNRYDPGKNLNLAIESFRALKGIVPSETFKQMRLVFAGACDERLPENRETLRHLQELTAMFDLQEQVIFLRSLTDAEINWLLNHCICLVYTSINEHFGIGVVEAMAAGRAVVAVNKGGPLETIENDVTGILCDPVPAAFANAIARIAADPAAAERMGREGRQRVAAKFSRAAFGDRLNSIIGDIIKRRSNG
ncbi:MAG: glycosyltransferase [Nitrospira sp.]|nr:glycosyltransferase [Nitrospira sp.]